MLRWHVCPEAESWHDFDAPLWNGFLLNQQELGSWGPDAVASVHGRRLFSTTDPLQALDALGFQTILHFCCSWCAVGLLRRVDFRF